MKISELIKSLTTLQEKYDDLPVFFDDESYGEQEVEKLVHLPPSLGSGPPLDFPALPERILICDLYHAANFPTSV